MKRILTITLALILPSSFVIADQINDHLKPEGLISQEEAIVFQNTYLQIKNKSTITKHNDNIPREFVFELNRLKKYIAYVEAEAERLGHSDLALRIYLAAYPPEYKDNNNAETTIFFTPAAHNIRGKTSGEYENIYDIEPLNYGHAGKPPKEY